MNTQMYTKFDRRMLIVNTNLTSILSLDYSGSDGLYFDSLLYGSTGLGE